MRDELFWAKVDTSGACWLWTGATVQNGYGKVKRRAISPSPLYAHRYAYEQLVGPVPHALQLDHLCRVRLCVRPDHLEPVTAKVNLNRGRHHLRERTSCRKGHEYTPENTIRWGKEQARRCRTCLTN